MKTFCLTIKKDRMEIKRLKPFCFFINNQKSSGFTLIELLVTILIITTITSIGIATYSNFNKRKVVENAAEELRSNLRLAQSRAVNNEKDCSACDGADNRCGTADDEILLYWEADFSRRQFFGVCGINTEFGHKELVDLVVENSPNPISLGWGGVIRFNALGGTNLLSDVTITLSYEGYTPSINVSKNGDISEVY